MKDNVLCPSCIYRNECKRWSREGCKWYLNESAVARGVITSGDPTFEINAGPQTKSHLKIGNMVIHNTHHFNWFHRKMWKLLFGFDIENVED